MKSNLTLVYFVLSVGILSFSYGVATVAFGIFPYADRDPRLTPTTHIGRPVSARNAATTASKSVICAADARNLGCIPPMKLRWSDGASTNAVAMPARNNRW